jgi:hypothetical protein
MMEGSGPGPLTKRSGSGRPKKGTLLLIHHVRQQPTVPGFSLNLDYEQLELMRIHADQDPKPLKSEKNKGKCYPQVK